MSAHVLLRQIAIGEFGLIVPAEWAHRRGHPVMPTTPIVHHRLNLTQMPVRPSAGPASPDKD